MKDTGQLLTSITRTGNLKMSYVVITYNMGFVDITLNVSSLTESKNFVKTNQRISNTKQNNVNPTLVKGFVNMVKDVISYTIIPLLKKCFK